MSAPLQPRQPPPAPAAVNKVYTGDVVLSNAAGIAKFAPLQRGATKIEGHVGIGCKYGGLTDPGPPISPPITDLITDAQLVDLFGAVREITGRVSMPAWPASRGCTR